MTIFDERLKEKITAKDLNDFCKKNNLIIVVRKDGTYDFKNKERS